MARVSQVFPPDTHHSFTFPNWPVLLMDTEIRRCDKRTDGHAKGTCCRFQLRIGQIATWFWQCVIYGQTEIERDVRKTVLGYSAIDVVFSL